MDIEELKRKLDTLEALVQKSQQPTENLTNGVSANDVKFIWTDYNKLLKEFKRYSDLFGEYREVNEPATIELESNHTASVVGYKFESLKPLLRQIQALKSVIDLNYF
jgi:hypothetical protein